MLSASGGFALPEKILNLSSVKERTRKSAASPQGETVFFLCKRFADETPVPGKLLGGSARLRWVSEESKHRRSASRQRGSRSSSPEQCPLDTCQAGGPPGDRRLEVGLKRRVPQGPAER